MTAEFFNEGTQNKISQTDDKFEMFVIKDIVIREIRNKKPIGSSFTIGEFLAKYESDKNVEFDAEKKWLIASVILSELETLGYCKKQGQDFACLKLNPCEIKENKGSGVSKTDCKVDDFEVEKCSDLTDEKGSDFATENAEKVRIENLVNAEKIKHSETTEFVDKTEHSVSTEPAKIEPTKIEPAESTEPIEDKIQPQDIVLIRTSFETEFNKIGYDFYFEYSLNFGKVKLSSSCFAFLQNCGALYVMSKPQIASRIFNDFLFFVETAKSFSRPEKGRLTGVVVRGRWANKIKYIFKKRPSADQTKDFFAKILKDFGIKI